MAAREVPRETWMVVARGTALHGKILVALDDGDTDPFGNRQVNDVGDVAGAVAKTAVRHFVAAP